MSRKSNIEDIENAKENILPIRQGRQVDVICSVLGNKDDQTQHEKRSYFENQLRSYTGDDPLKIWLEYISWVEQNCITGGKDFNIVELTKKCLFALKDKEIYRNDPRILPIWLKFANASADPLEVFSYMASNGFCCMLAHFYVEWAWKFQAVGNLRDANATLQDGKNIGAKPHEALQHAISQLDLRSVKTVRGSSEVVPSGAEERHAFNKLEPQGKKHAAPVLRVGDYVQERGHFLSSGKNPQQHSKLSGPFKIFQGEESVPKKTQVPSKSVPSYIFNPQVNKENLKKPDKWTDVKTSKSKCPQPGGTKDLGFAFHCDEDEETEAEKVIPKKPATNEFAVLSVKKDAVYSPPIAIFEDEDPNKKPMYDKVKVYCGGTEFSFEEIHAAILYREQRKERSSEEWFLRLQKATQELEEKGAVFQKSDDNFSMQREEEEHCIENVPEDADVEKLCPDPKPPERSVHSSLYQSSHEKAVEEIHAPSTGSHHLGDENFSHSHTQSSTPHDAMTADILAMMQNLCNGPSVRENCGISNYAGTTENVQSVSSHATEPVLASMGAEVKQNLGSQEPFKIYCDVTEVVPSLHLRSDVDIQVIPDVQKVQDVENIPPPDYYNKNVIHNELLSPPSSSAVIIGSQSACGTSSPEEEKADCDPNEQSKLVQENYTIVPPPDTAHFMLDAFVASTPCAKTQPSTSSCSKYNSWLSSYHPKEGNADQIPPVLDIARAKSGMKSKEVAEELLVSSDRTQSTVSVKPFNPCRMDQLRLSVACSNTAPEPVTTRTDKPLEDDFQKAVVIDPERSSSGSSSHDTFKVASLDPFGKNTHQICLQKIKKPLEQWDNYYTSSGSVKTVDCGEQVVFGDETYVIMRNLGQGAFATVYQAVQQTDFTPGSSSAPWQKKRVAIKVGSSSIVWEFYICTELHVRHGSSPGIDTRGSLMKVSRLLSFRDGSVFITDLCEYGTLVDVINSYKILQEPVPEAMVMFLTFQILCIVSRVHKLGIIHGDLKPDNFLIAQVPSPEEAIADLWTKTQCVRLIDFGRSVDLTLFEPKTAFVTKVRMFGGDRNLNHSPFLYEVDWFGLVGTVHALLFSQYMKVDRNEEGLVMPTQKFKRYWYTEELWEPLFQKLLNLTLDDGEPDVMPFLQFIASKLNPQDLRLPFLRLKQHERK